MAETRLIQKQLAGKEDLLLGIGKATQKRASGDREITKLNVTELQGALVVETIEDLENLDPTKLSEKTVIVKDLDRGGIFIYDSTKVAESNNGTNFNGWIRQYDGAVNVKWFGAKGDGVTDDTLAIQNAINITKEVYIPKGVFISGALYLSSGCSLFGDFNISGWARNSSYLEGGIIRLKDNSNCSLININTSSLNISINNLTLDGNKENQTTYNSNGIYSPFGGSTRSLGQSYFGLKVVNFKGFAGAFEGGPINIDNCFFMSGAFFNRCSDLKIANTDFDGTDGLHPSLWINETSSSNISNCFVWGWGEVADGIKTTVTFNVVSINTATNLLTIDNYDSIYENMPVVFYSATTYPNIDNVGVLKFDTWFVKKEGNNNISLWFRPIGNANNVQMNFVTTGADLILGWGHNEGALITKSKKLGVSNIRIAGTQGEALRLNNVVSSSFSGLRLWGMNYLELNSLAGLRIFDSAQNVFSNNMIGENIGFAPKIDNAIYLSYHESACEGNIFDISNQLFNIRSAKLVIDSTNNSYLRRNVIDCHTQPDSVTDRIDSRNYDLQPYKQYFKGSQGATSIPQNTNTTINIVKSKSNGITNTGNSINIVETTNGLYKYTGRLRLLGFDSTIVSVKLNVLINNDNTNYYFAMNVPSIADGGRGISVPFEVDRIATTLDEQSINISFVLFVQGGGASMTLDANTEYSSINIIKIADIPYSV